MVCVLQRYFIFNERKQVFTFVLGIFGEVLVHLYYGSVPSAVRVGQGHGAQGGEGVSQAPPQPAHLSTLFSSDGVKARVSGALISAALLVDGPVMWCALSTWTPDCELFRDVGSRRQRVHQRL